MLSYQAVEVIAQALEEGKSTDPRSSGTPSPTCRSSDPLLAFDGPITFDSTGQNENATVIVMQVQNGKVEQVFPTSFETAKLVFPVPAK